MDPWFRPSLEGVEVGHRLAVEVLEEEVLEHSLDSLVVVAEHSLYALVVVAEHSLAHCPSVALVAGHA